VGRSSAKLRSLRVNNDASYFTNADWIKLVITDDGLCRSAIQAVTDLASGGRFLPVTEADRTPRGSLLACMTANHEPSNQSFEIDREATVCTASRRFLPFCGRVQKRRKTQYLTISNIKACR
jgi:hypothetical protein